MEGKMDSGSVGVAGPETASPAGVTAGDGARGELCLLEVPKAGVKKR